MASVVAEAASPMASPGRQQILFRQAMSYATEQELAAYKKGESDVARMRVNMAAAILHALASNRNTDPDLLIRMIGLPGEVNVDEAIAGNHGAAGRVLHALTCEHTNALDLARVLLDNPQLFPRTRDFILSYALPTPPTPDPALAVEQAQQAENRMVMNHLAAKGQLAGEGAVRYAQETARASLDRRATERRRFSAAAMAAVEVDRRLFDRRQGERRGAEHREDQ